MKDTKYKFTFSATFPKGHKMGGGTFVDGEFECPANDLRENLPNLMRDMVAEIPTENLEDQTVKLEVKPI